MKIDIQPGTYVVAVSGGVDSMALLDMLTKQGQRAEGRGQRNAAASPFALRPSPWRLIVAHYDHGIRADSKLDRQLVQETAKKYGLPFVYDEGKLGKEASEAQARQARYKFLRHVRETSKARAIITAHHQDDALETAIINWLRGTGRRGYTALRNDGSLKRPLLNIPKQELINYARRNHLKWREDSTNQDPAYVRNFIRLKLMPQLTAGQRSNLVKAIEELRGLNERIDHRLINFLHTQPIRQHIDRHWFIMLPHDVALEVLAMWLRLHDCAFDTKTLNRLAVAAKTFKPGQQADVDRQHILKIESVYLALQPR
jgi:tRNA(Ile)-lysidine synthase